MLDIVHSDVVRLEEADIPAATRIFNDCEIKALNSRGLTFSAKETKKGRARAEQRYRPLFAATILSEMLGEELKGSFDRNKLAGYSWYGQDSCPENVITRFLRGKTAELRHLYVKPGYQGQGLGKAMFTEASFTLREAGFARMRLLTEADNDLARALYERLGGNTNGQPVGLDEYGTPMVNYDWDLSRTI